MHADIPALWYPVPWKLVLIVNNPSNAKVGLQSLQSMFHLFKLHASLYTLDIECGMYVNPKANLCERYHVSYNIRDKLVRPPPQLLNLINFNPSMDM